MADQRKTDMKICRLMGWQYSGGWAFDKSAGGVNVTGKLEKVRNEIKAKRCLMCDDPIGDDEWQPVQTLERFGQALFRHAACDTRGTA